MKLLMKPSKSLKSLTNDAGDKHTGDKHTVKKQKVTARTGHERTGHERTGQVRVGRCIYGQGGARRDPSYDGFTKIVVLMKSHSEWGVIGPYCLVDTDKRIMENIWQFSKVYEKVSRSYQKQSRYSDLVIWDHPAETHVLPDGTLTPEYWAWRKKGMTNRHPIRYPVGFNDRHMCLYALEEKPDKTVNIYECLGYIESRKRIYVNQYCNMVKTHPKFWELKTRLDNGENLLIVEVDGPHQESLEYYKEKYPSDVDNTFIENNTMLVNAKNIEIMLNDSKHPFGHGYCLAMALLDKEVEWNT